MFSFNISLKNHGCVGYLDQAALIDNLMTVLTVFNANALLSTALL